MNQAGQVLCAFVLIAFIVTVAESSEPEIPCEAPASHQDVTVQRTERFRRLPENADPALPPGLRPNLERKLSIHFRFREPAKHTFEFLEDASRVEIIHTRGLFRNRSLDLQIDGRRLDEVLDAFCTELELDWDTDGYIVYVGSERSVSRFRRLVNTRQARREKYPRRVAQSLQKRVHFNFDGTPAKSGIGWLSQMINVPMRLAPEPKLGKLRLWFATRLTSVPADVALDIISAEHGLVWSVGQNGTVLVRYLPEEL